MEPQDRHALLVAAEEIDRHGNPDFLFMVRQLLAAVGGDPDGVVEQAETCVRRLKEQQAGFRPEGTREDARRRLQNARLRTPTPDDRVVGLMAKKLNLHEDLSDLLAKVVPLAVQLAHVEVELAEVLKLRDALRDGRRAYAETGLYPDALSFVADLHSEYGVTHAHFAAMDESERLAIAKILHRRDDLKRRPADDFL